VGLVTVTTVLFSVSAALATLVVVLFFLVLRRPRRDDPADAAGSVFMGVNERLEGMARELSDALERANEDGRRARFLTELTGSLDLDEVLRRTLDAAAAMPGIDAAMIVLEQGDAGPLVATHGMNAEEAGRQPLNSPPGGGKAQAVTVNYRYAAGQTGRNGDLIRGGLFVPLIADERNAIGTLAVFWRGGDREPSRDEIAAVEELAAGSGPAVENARRFREARQLADLDALTELHNRRYFQETLEREVARAQRYERPLGLMVLDLDDFKAINDRTGHLAGDAVLAQAAERVREVVRSADIACRIGGDEFAVILPESTREEAEQLYTRLQRAVSSHPIADVGRLFLSAGIAELRRGDDATSIFARADAALYRAKKAGKGQMSAADDLGESFRR